MTWGGGNGSNTTPICEPNLKFRDDCQIDMVICVKNHNWVFAGSNCGTKLWQFVSSPSHIHSNGNQYLCTPRVPMSCEGASCTNMDQFFWAILDGFFIYLQLSECLIKLFHCSNFSLIAFCINLPKLGNCHLRGRY